MELRSLLTKDSDCFYGSPAAISFPTSRRKNGEKGFGIPLSLQRILKQLESCPGEGNRARKSSSEKNRYESDMTRNRIEAKGSHAEPWPSRGKGDWVSRSWEGEWRGESDK